MPVVVAGHLDITGSSSGAAGPSYISGGGGGASFDNNASDSSFTVTTVGAGTSVAIAFGNGPIGVWNLPPRCQVQPHQSTTTNVWIVVTATQLTIQWTGSAVGTFDVECIGASAR